MKRFGTDAFRFNLPGDGWKEETLQHFSPEGNDESAFMIGRRERSVDAAESLERTFATFPKLDKLEVELVRSEEISVGSLPATDLGIVIRTTTGADYMRIVLIPYYDSELYLNWGGPAAERSAIDTRVARTLETMRFRRQ